MMVTFTRSPMAMTGAVCFFLSACVAPSNPPPAYARALAERPPSPYFPQSNRAPVPQQASYQISNPQGTVPPATTNPPVVYPPIYPPVNQPTYPAPQPVPQPAPQPAPPPPIYSAPPPVYSPPPPPPPRPVYAPPRAGGKIGYSNPAPQLEPQLNALWKGFPGKTGIAVRRIDGDWSVSERGNELFPQQSVSKFWVAMTIFDKIDRGQVSLDDDVRIGPEDLTLFHQPIRARVLREGPIRVKVRDLLELSMTKSDCTANDSLLRHAGGPQAVRAFLRNKGINNVRFSEGERHMQSTIAGMTWQQSYSLGNNFEVARSRIPGETRQRLLNNYVQNPIDGASPEALAMALARLARGELLSQNSTERMLGIMSRTTSGPNRLKAGLPAGWRFLHKTGTGQVYGSMQTGYNDVGIATAPDGTRYAVVVMMGSTFSPIPERMRMMQGVSRAVATSHVK